MERREAGATVSYVYRSLKPSWRMDFAVARFTTIRDGDLAVHHLPEDSAGARRILDAMSRTLKLYTRWFGPLRGSSSFAVIGIPLDATADADRGFWVVAAAACCVIDLAWVGLFSGLAAWLARRRRYHGSSGGHT